METITITYMLKLSIASAIFYAIYALLFRKDTFLKTRRAYLAFALVFSASYPLVAFQLPKETIEQIPSFLLPAIEINAKAPLAETSQMSLLSIEDMVMAIIYGVTIFFLIKFVFQLTSLIRLRIKGQTVVINHTKIIEIEQENTMPFSFFNWIFISKNSKPSNLTEIITHESIHARQWHSVDVMLAELFCTLFWWNPFAWLLKKEIRNNLEYLADKGVIDKGFDQKNYQFLLLQATSTHTGISIINNFNVSQLKTRIMMMNKEKTSTLRSTKYLLAIPIVAALLFSNNILSQDNKEKDESFVMTNIKIAENEPKNETAKPKNEEFVMVNIPVTATKEPIQATQKPQKAQKAVVDQAAQKDKPMVVVEVMPAYKGGESAMYQFIGQNLKYPINAQKAGIQGKATVRFVVTKEGKIEDVVLMRSTKGSQSNKLQEVVVVAHDTDKEESIDTKKALKELDAEAMRVISMMPDWIPGEQDGKKVAVYYTLPIVFKLNK